MNKKVRNLLIVCLALIAVGGIGYVVYYMVSLNQNEDVYQEAREVAKPEPAEEPAAEEPETVIPIDFEALWEMNPDVYAWIEIPGTQVDYPILQSPTDDGYYLDHNMDGSEGESAQSARAFAEQLRALIDVPVHMQDERGTTITAHGYLNDTDTRGKKRKAVVDAVAATIILEDYLMYRRNRKHLFNN